VNRAVTLLLSFFLLATPALANDCETAGHDAEQAHGLPADLLVAIGRIESGRRGTDGRVAPWPWSVNAAGQGYYLNSAGEAISLVRSLQARGVRSIDVGCFQVNIMYHPGAFASLEEAFDPGINARAAGAFLRDLRGIAAGWEDAVGRYHSADPSLGIPYMRQVVASWHGGAGMLAAPVSQVAALVRVIVPQAFAAARTSNAPAGITAYAAATSRVVRPVAMSRGGFRLPVVITPSSSRL
jgi:hypothetical protein